MKKLAIFIAALVLLSETCSAQSSSLQHWVIQPSPDGVYIGATGGEESNERSCAGVSRAAGRTMQFCVNNRYTIFNLSGILTDGITSEMSANGTIPVLALGCRGNGTPTSGGDVTFSSIASGAQDELLRRDAAALKAYATKFPKNPWVMVRPFHEFNENIGNPQGHPNRNNCYSMPEGLPQMQSEFISAFRHVVTYFVSHGATNVTWLWCPAVGPATWDKHGGDALLRGFYPGDAYVDWTCADTYDKAPGGGGVGYTFQNVGFFSQFHKPLIIAETAECNADARSRKCEGNSRTQASFISDLASGLKPGGALAGNGIKALVYFDQSVRTSGYNWSLDANGLNAFRALLNDPYFHPQMPSPRQQ